MKKLLPKLFFVSDSAKGMLFALTLFFVGSCLWWSLLHLLVVRKDGYINPLHLCKKPGKDRPLSSSKKKPEDGS